MVLDGNETSKPPEEIRQFNVGLTSQGYRAFTLEGVRIPGCYGKTFDGVTNAVRAIYPVAQLYAVVLSSEGVQWP